METSMTVEEINTNVINKSEGGLSNNASDRGGLTKYGISIKWYRAAVNNSAQEDVIRNLTLSEAVALYKEYFWWPLNINSIRDKGVQEKYFDMGINMGMGQAARLMQRACNILEQKDSLQEDGILGPVSISKINFYSDEMLPVLRALQYMFYKSIVDNNPSQRIFWNGWRKRAYV